MVRRIWNLLCVKVRSIFSSSIAFTARVEGSAVSKKAKIWRGCVVSASSFGDYTYIGPRSRVIHAHLGKFCSVGDDCKIGMGTHSLSHMSTSSLFTARKNGTGRAWVKDNCFEEYEEVYIGNDVWIGQSALILGGVTIGNGAVIGTGAVVTKDVPPYAIVGGVPAKLIRYRFTEEIIKKLESSKWWELDDETLRHKIDIFQKPLEEQDIEKLLG